MREGNRELYLESEEVRWLRNAGLTIPKGERVGNCLEPYHLIGIGTYYDILDYATTFIMSNRREWSKIREYMIALMPRLYLRTAYRFTDYVLAGIPVKKKF